MSLARRTRLRPGRPPRRVTPLRANPATTRAWLDRSRRRKSPIPPGVRRALAVRSGGRCEFPGCEWPAVHAHHRLRRSQGGKHTLANLVHLCGRHHALVHDNPEWAYARGFLVRSTPGPSAEAAPMQTCGACDVPTDTEPVEITGSGAGVYVVLCDECWQTTTDVWRSNPEPA